MRRGGILAHRILLLLLLRNGEAFLPLFVRWFPELLGLKLRGDGDRHSVFNLYSTSEQENPLRKPACFLLIDTLQLGRFVRWLLMPFRQSQEASSALPDCEAYQQLDFLDSVDLGTLFWVDYNDELEMDVLFETEFEARRVFVFFPPFLRSFDRGRVACLVPFFSSFCAASLPRGPLAFVVRWRMHLRARQP